MQSPAAGARGRKRQIRQLHQREHPSRSWQNPLHGKSIACADGPNMCGFRIAGRQSNRALSLCGWIRLLATAMDGAFGHFCSRHAAAVAAERDCAMGKDRLAAFSDGVIAILITIMVLELRVPHGADLKTLASVAPSFLT